jgi:monofunctional biosynthetic peptidoglycan transglycosylase
MNMMREKILVSKRMENWFNKKPKKISRRKPLYALTKTGRSNQHNHTLHPVRKCVKTYAKSLKFPRLPFNKVIRLLISRYGACLVCLAGFFHLLLFLFTAEIGLMFSVVNPPVTSLMLDRITNYHFNTKPVQFISINKISPSIQNLLVRLEDKNFYKHPGVDFEALQYAYKLNTMYNRTVSGGSTITMQLTRTLLLNLDKNYFRKYVEILMAFTLDAIIDKKRILELYFNYIEWGKGVYGIGAAAEYHYHKSYYKLNMDQICRLLTIISSPVKYDVTTFVRSKTMIIRYNFLCGSY